MYTRLYQQCSGTTAATSSVTKFMPPKSCNYYMVKKQVAENIILDAPINIKYNFPCIDYDNLQLQFQEIVKKETLSDSDAVVANMDNLFNPIHWGPAAWKFFETVAFHYPKDPTEEEQHAAFEFFNSLKELLPCEKCKVHFEENIGSLPINVESRDTLSRWVVKFHNIVNKSLGKPIVQYDDVKKKYPDQPCPDCKLKFD